MASGAGSGRKASAALTLALVGVGNVGAEVWWQIENVATDLAPPDAASAIRRGSGCRLAERFAIVAAATRSRGILSATGGRLSYADWLSAPLQQRGGAAARILSWLRTRPADILVELTALTPDSGRPAADFIRTALDAGMHVVTANKGPEAYFYRQLSSLARRRNVQYRFEAAVMDDAPVFGLPALFRERRLVGLEGILNSTTNYILSAIEAGGTYKEALAEAQRLGIAEADPTHDLDGWDSALKLCVLANVLLGLDVRPADVTRTAVSGLLKGGGLRASRENGRCLRLLARADIAPVRLTVAPEWVAQHDPYAAVRGTSSILTYRFADGARFAITEIEPTLRNTAQGVIADLIAISEGR
jgi:homoserine dehydrogenase